MMKHSSWVTSFAGILWLAGTARGMGLLIEYEVSPGAAVTADAPAHPVGQDSEPLLAASDDRHNLGRRSSLRFNPTFGFEIFESRRGGRPRLA